MGVPFPKGISAEMEKSWHRIWQEDLRRFVRLASCDASAVFIKGQGTGSTYNLDINKGRALLERVMEMILEEINKTEDSLST